MRWHPEAKRRVTLYTLHRYARLFALGLLMALGVLSVPVQAAENTITGLRIGEVQIGFEQPPREGHAEVILGWNIV